MWNKKALVVVLVVAALTSVGLRKTWAQGPDAAKASESEKTVHAYRLDFSVSELEDGKKINTRQYSMNLNAKDSNEIKIGSKIPVDVKEGEFHYLDVGTSIWSKLEEVADGVVLTVRAHVSSFANPDQQTSQTHPLVREMQFNGSTVATLGKPAVLGVLDDPNSRHQFQLEVTVSRLR